jgi:hypothetical protein
MMPAAQATFTEAARSIGPAGLPITRTGLASIAPMKTISRVSCVRLLAVSVCAAFAAAGCHRRAPAGPPVATPSLSIDRSSVALGSPVELHYHFTVASDAHFTEDYLVMVHFVNPDGDLMWTDDHMPPIPTTQWKPGQSIDYTRTIFMPVYPYVGPATVQMGLYSSKSQQRLTLSGDDMGQRAYKVASVTILPQTANVPLSFLDGWNTPEKSGLLTLWRWTQKDATIVFPNPKHDATFYLDLDNPSDAFADPQQVTVRLGDRTIAQFSLPSRKRELHKITITAAQFGNAPTGTLYVDVDKTFVPAQIPSLHSPDARELGVRVFQVALLPAGEAATN